MRSIPSSIAFTLLVTTSCSAPHIVDPTIAHAQCPVCVAEGDLACVDVLVRDTTPRLELDGHTYFFCSEDCRRTFEGDPSRYRGSH